MVASLLPQLGSAVPDLASAHTHYSAAYIVVGTAMIFLGAILLHCLHINNAPTQITVVRKNTTTGKSRPTPTTHSRRPWMNARASGHDSHSHRRSFRGYTCIMEALALLAAPALLLRSNSQRTVVSRRTRRQGRRRSTTTSLGKMAILVTVLTALLVLSLSAGSTSQAPSNLQGAPRSKPEGRRIVCCPPAGVPGGAKGAEDSGLQRMNSHAAHVGRTSSGTVGINGTSYVASAPHCPSRAFSGRASKPPAYLYHDLWQQRCFRFVPMLMSTLPDYVRYVRYAYLLGFVYFTILPDVTLFPDASIYA